MKFLYTLSFSVLLLLMANFGYAQCNNSIEVSSKIEKSLDAGSISVVVRSNDFYSCALVLVTSHDDEIIENKSGQGNETLVFDNLKTGVSYSVRVSFSTEEKFLCRNLNKTVLLK